MAEIINLRRARKDRARAAAAAEAAANRMQHGRTGADRRHEVAETRRAERALDAVKRDDGQIGSD